MYKSGNSLYGRDLKHLLGKNDVVINRRPPSRRFFLIGLSTVTLAAVLLLVSQIPSSLFDFSLPSFSGNAHKTRTIVTSFGDRPVVEQTIVEESTVASEPGEASEEAAASVESTDVSAPPEDGIVIPENLNWTTHRVKRGDTLGKVFNKLQLKYVDAITIAGIKEAKILKRLTPGNSLEFGLNSDGQFQILKYELGAERSLVVSRDGEDFKTGINKRDLEVREQYATGVISSSLFNAAGNAGISDKVVMDLVAIFGWDIDFALDLRKGDHFTLVYEEKFWRDKKVTDGNVIAAEFHNHGKTYRAIRHVDESGYGSYYTPSGLSMRRTFLKTPVEFSRISSKFNKKRYHPILKKWRAHKGVDYAAPRGTQVLATADGKIVFVGRKGGYGKTIILKHGGKYSTLYGHMSGYKKGIRRGARVRQGQIIGFVGHTGLATGPHLHYEFRVNGVHKNPLKHKQPKAAPIADRYKQEFMNLASRMQAKLDSIKVAKSGLARGSGSS